MFFLIKQKLLKSREMQHLQLLQVCLPSGQRCVFCELRDHIQFHRDFYGAAAHTGADRVRLPALLGEVSGRADSREEGKQNLTHLVLTLRSVQNVGFFLQSQAYEFQFGLEYAWTMCIFAVSMTYSITCPIITPFGE